MSVRVLAAVLPLAVAASCTPPPLPSIPSLPKLDMSGTDLARLATGSPDQRFERTRRIALTPEEAEQVRSAVADAFQSPTALGFIKINAGTTKDGDTEVCGLVTARDLDQDGSTMSYIFRMERPAGEDRFILRQIAGSRRTDQIDVYGACSAMALL